MNNATVLKCANMAASMQMSAFGYVDAEVQALIDELTPAQAPAEVKQVSEEPTPEVVDEPVKA